MIFAYVVKARENSSQLRGFYGALTSICPVSFCDICALSFVTVYLVADLSTPIATTYLHHIQKKTGSFESFSPCFDPDTGTVEFELKLSLK
eukprot:662773-Amphidinium_carterae.1